MVEHPQSISGGPTRLLKRKMTKEGKLSSGPGGLQAPGEGLATQQRSGQPLHGTELHNADSISTRVPSTQPVHTELHGGAQAGGDEGTHRRARYLRLTAANSGSKDLEWVLQT